MPNARTRLELMPSRETQLKRRFEKWGIKKNFSRHDMCLMLSMETEQAGNAQATQTQWRGYEGNKDRVEFASKKSKDLQKAPTG